MAGFFDDILDKIAGKKDDPAAPAPEAPAPDPEKKTFFVKSEAWKREFPDKPNP